MASGGERKARVLKGFRDQLPQQMILRQQIVGIFRGIFERHGFEPIDTPALEYLDVLTGKAGENERLMYQFTDHGGREVGLRYDLTGPLARVVAQHGNDLTLPFKRYHIAPVWRAENPQRGRTREFWQCDADIAGTASMIADAEVVAIMAEALRAVGLPGFTINISHRRLLASLARAAGVPDERAGTVYRSADKLAKIGPDGVLAEMTEHGVDPEAGRRLLEVLALAGEPFDLLDELQTRLGDLPPAESGLADLRELFTLLPSFGVTAETALLDLTLARGLDYYTGPVFEATVLEPRIGSVGGAGRYDGLVGTFLGREVPATGMSLGLERIIEVVQEHHLLPTPRSVAQVTLLAFPDTVGDAARLATELRQGGLRVDLGLQPNRGIGDQLKQADRRGIPLAVIVGASELAAGNVSVKDLRDGVQTTLPRAGLADRLRAMLDG